MHLFVSMRRLFPARLDPWTRVVRIRQPCRGSHESGRVESPLRQREDLEGISHVLRNPSLYTRSEIDRSLATCEAYARSGSIPAQRLLGIAHLHHIPLSPSVPSAMHLLESSVRGDDPEAMFALGMALVRGPEQIFRELSSSSSVSSSHEGVEEVTTQCDETPSPVFVDGRLVLISPTAPSKSPSETKSNVISPLEEAKRDGIMYRVLRRRQTHLQEYQDERLHARNEESSSSFAIVRSLHRADPATGAVLLERAAREHHLVPAMLALFDLYSAGSESLEVTKDICSSSCESSDTASLEPGCSPSSSSTLFSRVECDPSLARSWLELAVQHQSPEAMFRLACLVEETDQVRFLRLLSESSLRNDPSSLYLLAVRLHLQQVSWTDLSSVMSLVTIEFPSLELSPLFELMKISPSDLHRVELLLRVAATKSLCVNCEADLISSRHPEAAFYLAQLYRSGELIEPCVGMGVDLLRCAAESFHCPDACLSYADYFLREKKDEMQALHWSRCAAKLGVAEAHTFAGALLFEQGRYDDALLEYIAGFECGSAACGRNIAHMYAFGIGVQKDTNIAGYFLRKVANLDESNNCPMAAHSMFGLRIVLLETLFRSISPLPISLTQTYPSLLVHVK